jgi:hypothetical protein
MANRNALGNGCLLGLLLLVFLSQGRSDTPVLRDGQTLLPVWMSKDAASEERAAGEELARVLGKIANVDWPVHVEVSGEERGFHIGRTRMAARAGSRLVVADDLLAPKEGESGPGDFRIRTVDGSVLIDAATPEATPYAVSWFLQRYAGARWYAPGERGEVVPSRKDWILPDITVVVSAAYVSRDFYALGSTEEKTWAVRNGLRGRLEFNHALANVVTAADLVAQQTWAPLLRGKRYEPTSAKDHHWQPNLALPAVATHAAERALEAFLRAPQRPSFSLGMNDTVRFDQSEDTQALISPLRYFRGMPDYSPLVFTFMNRAAESLAQTHPHRYLGCLAYFWCENTPPFPVHPQVVPYVTTDRSLFYDQEYRDADFALMTRWGKSGVKAFGLWEYGYGQNFLVPRVPHRALLQAVSEGWRRGARGYFMDITPQWGFDAFKVWAVAQLLWNPELTFDELADDFFNGYYGVAAQPMRAFFQLCEAQWMRQSGEPYWLKFYQQEDQAVLFPSSVCQELRALLDEAARVAVGDEVIRSRVELTSRAFAVTEAYVSFDDLRRTLSALSPDTDGVMTGDESMLGRLIGRLVLARQRLVAAWTEAERGGLPAMRGTELSYFMRNDPVPRLLALVARHDPTAVRRILDTAGAGYVKIQPWCFLVDTAVLSRLETAPELLLNGAFTELTVEKQMPEFLFPRSGRMPAHWLVNAVASERGSITFSAHEDARALRIEGAWDTQIFQWLPAEPGLIYRAQARLRGESSSGNDAGIFMTFLSEAGKVVGTHRMQTLPKGSTASWRQMLVIDQAPADAAWVGVGIGASRQQTGDWLEIESVGLRAAKTEIAP